MIFTRTLFNGFFVVLWTASGAFLFESLNWISALLYKSLFFCGFAEVWLLGSTLWISQLCQAAPHSHSQTLLQLCVAQVLQLTYLKPRGVKSCILAASNWFLQLGQVINLLA